MKYILDINLRIHVCSTEFYEAHFNHGMQDSVLNIDRQMKN